MAGIETGVLYRDDNLARLSQLPSESVDLIYLDPPFFSNRFYEVIWGDEAEVRSFDDRWEGGLEHYIDWMHQRVVEMHRVLKSTGSLYLHCDPHASHYLKVMLDGVFRPSMFRNEIIWRRSGSHNSARRFGPIHDVILFYSKSDDYKFRRVYRPYMRGHVESFFKKEDERGRYWTNALTGAGERNGLSGEPWKRYDPTTVGRHWAIPGRLLDELDVDPKASSQEKLDALDRAGFVGHPEPESDAMPTYRQYLDSSPGMPCPDIWAYQPHTNGVLYGSTDCIDEDVRWLTPRDSERLGYPTQKPEALLERILRSSSDEGDVVLDPFCGCGTTIAVAERLKRDWIGIDISPTAMEIMRRRITIQTEGRVTPTIVGAPTTTSELKELSPFEFQNWVINAMYGTHSPRKVGDMGIDGYSFFTKDPIQVKQSEKVGRPAIDSFQTAVRRYGSDTGFIVAFSFTRGAVNEVARAKKEGLQIHLVRVAQLLLQQKTPGDRRVDIGPQPASLLELPLPPTRKQKDLPTAEELIESERRRAHSA